MQKSFSDSQKQFQVLKIPENIRQDALGYRSRVKMFLDGETSPAAFRGYRVPMGIYEQRRAGKYMVRIRIPAGIVLPRQLERIAELSKTYGNGILHITTRQDIQIHEVKIEDTADILENLLEAGLSSRGGGGNTVRNITACPRSGVCPKERFDVSPYAIAAAEYLLQDRSSFNLPRKYKIVFSGCSEDCAFASVADLGFFAHIEDNVKGFAVYAAGGLGSHPAVAVKIEDFISDNKIFAVAEAVKRLFDKYGDRSNKHQARLRYISARLGKEEFVKLYRKERDEISRQGLKGNIPEFRDIVSQFAAPKPFAESCDISALKIDVLPEKAEGLFTLKANLALGDITADNLEQVGKIAEEFGSGLIRTTQLQDIAIMSLPRQNLGSSVSALKKLNIGATDGKSPKVVACTGAATCKLGLCLSRGLAAAISDKLTQTSELSEKCFDKTIRISGCPNSCANHLIADIGFEGKAKRINGKLMPFYEVLGGARVFEGETKLAKRFGAVPAKIAPQLVSQIFKGGVFDSETISRLAAEYGILPVPISDDYYYDFGEEPEFSLAGRGPGECGAGVMDVIKLDIDEARDIIRKVPVNNESVYKAIVAAARALLVTTGLEPKKDREIFTAFSKYLIEPGWVKLQTQRLLDDALDWRMGDKKSIEGSLEQVKDLIARVEELFLSLDANLKFKVEPIVKKASIETDKAKNHIIDLRGVACPLNFVKAKIELEKLKIGDILEVLLLNRRIHARSRYSKNPLYHSQ